MQNNLMLYKEPQWSSKPLCDYSIQLIKEGIIISEQKLLSSFSKIGKTADIIVEDFIGQEVRAVLQHSDQGYLFVYKVENHSKVFVNKESIKENDFFRVYPNDILEFEGSECVLVIMGPAFMQRTEKMFTKQGRLEPKVLEKLQHVSWGFSEDAVNETIEKEDLMLYDEILNLSLLKSRKNLTENQKKKIAKLEEYQSKIEYLQKKIQSSSNSQTTEKLYEKLENLTGEKELSEESLRSSFFPNDFAKKTREKTEYDFSSSEDEYYNRAKVVVVERNNTDVQGELDRLVSEQEEITKELTDLSVNLDEDLDDPLDAYMAGNNVDLKEENFARLGARLKEVMEKITKIQLEHPNIQGVVKCSNAGIKAEIRIGNKKRKISQETTEKIKPIQAKDFNAYWEPPKDQTGDGKTDLNIKYGY